MQHPFSENRPLLPGNLVFFHISPNKFQCIILSFNSKSHLQPHQKEFYHSEKEGTLHLGLGPQLLPDIFINSDHKIECLTYFNNEDLLLGFRMQA